MAANDGARASEPAGDIAVVVTELQEQIDDLTATVESHQRMFERLRSAGLLPGDDDGEAR